MSTAAAGIAPVVRFQLKRFVRSSRARIASAVTFVVTAGIITVFHAQKLTAPVETWASSATLALFSLLAFVLPFVFASGLIAEEVSGRTLPYLLARPVGRIRVAVGKFAAAFLASGALIAVASLVLYVGCLVTHDGALGEALSQAMRMTLAATLLAAFYCAVCLFYSAALPDSANVAAAMHLGILEFGLARAPGFLRLASMNHHARVLAGVPAEGLMQSSVPNVPTWAAAGVLALGTAAALFLALLATQAREYRMGRSA